MSNSMYNNYPRIFSLSTVGIKYHGYQDYIFHPTRTDFVGESGYGKSMIGDMLQLIFVGAGEFRSGTEVDAREKRRPEGMVLDQASQNRLGYIFLNIEVAHNKFIVIGMYIEASAKRTSPFIIQAGFTSEREPLVPLSTPMTHRAFLESEMLLPIEVFVEKMNNLMENEPRIARVFKNNLKHYHTILKQNNILPIDVGSDAQKLKDYAQILQSFARGKGFKFDSDSLKSFLFGDRDAKTLLESFESESKQLKSSIELYQQNKDQIEKVERIGDALRKLDELSKQRSEAHKAQLTAEVGTCYQELERIKIRLSEDASSLNIVRYKLLLIQERDSITSLEKNQQNLRAYQVDISDLEISLRDKYQLEAYLIDLEKEKNALEHKYHNSRNEITKLNRVEKWIECHDGSLEVLLDHFSTQMRYRKEKEQLLGFTSHLQKQMLFSIFEASSWSKNAELARSESKERITELNKEIELLVSLKLFSDTANPDSLARWALDQTDPLSPEQESVLLHFQALSRYEVARVKGARFLPKPDEVFTQLEVYGQGEDGFWIDLAGVYEFIPTTSLHLLSKNKAELHNYLKEKHTEFDQRYETLIVEKENLERLDKALLTYGYTQTHADIFAKRAEIDAFIPDETLPKLQEEFDELIELYGRSQVLYREGIEIENTYKHIERQINEQRINEGKITQKIDDLKNKVINQNEGELKTAVIHNQNNLEEIRQNLYTNNNISNEIEIQVFKNIILKLSHKDLNELEKQLVEERTKLNMEIKISEQAKPDIEKNLQKARAAFEMELGVTFKPEEISGTLEVETAKKTFDLCHQAFTRALDLFIDIHAKEERYRLEDSRDVGYIARTAFPFIFPSSRETETSITQQIVEHLHVLNEKNRQLEESSAETVSRIFREVWKLYDSYIITIRRLRKFFSGKDTQITGRYNVKLLDQPSTKYPILWINDLIHNIALSNSPLFSNQAPNDSLQDIVIETFKRHAGGTRTPELKYLLDPKSYFDISFRLENERGTTHGSEGQAYTALALLCIARLSLVEGNHSKMTRGVRFMPIDEAEGIGSNYQTLYNLALKHSYQVVSMSINSVTGVKEGGQTTYTLIPNPDPTSGVNSDPFPHLGYYHEYAEKFYNKDEL